MNCSADPWDVTTETASTMDPPQVRCRLTYLPGNTTYFNIPYCYTLNTLFTMDPPQVRSWLTNTHTALPSPPLPFIIQYTLLQHNEYSLFKPKPPSFGRLLLCLPIIHTLTNSLRSLFVVRSLCRIGVQGNPALALALDPTVTLTPTQALHQPVPHQAVPLVNAVIIISLPPPLYKHSSTFISGNTSKIRMLKTSRRPKLWPCHLSNKCWWWNCCAGMISLLSASYSYPTICNFHGIYPLFLFVSNDDW